MLSEALVFGCARLAGGAEARASRALLRLCLDRGVRWFDTAPSYGMGMAEDVVGQVTEGLADVRVTAKVGSTRPSHPLARSWLRRFRRAIGAGQRTLDAPFEPFPPPATNNGGAFDPGSMLVSFRQSLTALRRERVDLLLLHEAYAEDVHPAVIAFLDEARTDGLADRVGYAHGATGDEATDACFPAGYHAQFAIPPLWFQGQATSLASSLTLHSLAKVGFWLAGRDSDFGRRLAKAAGEVGRADDKASQIACLFALAHLQRPDARLIFASTDQKRTAAFFEVVRRIDADGGLDTVARAFAVGASSEA